MDSALLKQLAAGYGNAFYLLDSQQFQKNFLELKAAFTAIYPNINIAYSYKTNYIPKLCRIINELGGYAEVVSDLELELAFRSNVSPEKIIWNGPYKNAEVLEQFLISGGTVHLDSAYETELLRGIAERYPTHTLRVGLRCNFDISDGVISRFGFDIEGKDFQAALKLIREHQNLHLNGLQCHFATRSLASWRARTEGMLALVDRLGIVPEYIDLGGGLFGKMADSLKEQFDTGVPTYTEYAKAIAPIFAKHFSGMKNPPLLLLEPGSALVGDCMKFVCKVINIKTVRGKAIATLLGSIYNINPTLNKKNLPIKVYATGTEQKEYHDLDFGGFTCIESDYLYRHYDGMLAVGDLVVFDNVGSYSIVLKPPFILPNFPVLEIRGEQVELIKRGENFDDLFHTFYSTPSF
jgi:diaminopimelate decarboxylase